MTTTAEHAASLRDTLRQRDELIAGKDRIIRNLVAETVVLRWLLDHAHIVAECVASWPLPEDHAAARAARAILSRPAE